MKYFSTMIDWQEIAAFGGLGIGVVNGGYTIWDARRKPAREDQRRYRAELRELLFAVNRDCEEANKTLRFGRDLPHEVPPSITSIEERLEKLSLVLLSPGATHLRLLSTVISAIETYWSSVTLQAENPNFRNDRGRNAADMRLKEALDRAIEQITKYQKIISDIDNGLWLKSSAIYRVYQ
jgi:hypothetical protein